MKVVVFGASGNIGSQLVAQLKDVADVVGVARRPPNRPQGISWYAADIASDDLHPLVRGADVVVNLAWLIMPSHEPDKLHQVNVVGTQRLLQAVADEGVPALVVASSVGAYSPGPKARRVDESYPTKGIPGSLYSRQKAAVERLLDGFEQEHPERRVVRIRPGIVMQPDAASSQARYFLGPLVPQFLIRPGLLPVVPRITDFVFQAVHAEDVARAFAAAVTTPVTGAFNVAGEPVVDADTLAEALSARPVPVPRLLVRSLVSAAWWLHLLPMDAGWIDMATRTPLMDTARARSELGWSPRHDVRDVLRSTVEAMGAGQGGDTPVLRPRSTLGRITEVLHPTRR